MHLLRLTNKRKIVFTSRSFSNFDMLSSIACAHSLPSFADFVNYSIAFSLSLSMSCSKCSPEIYSRARNLFALLFLSLTAFSSNFTALSVFCGMCSPIKSALPYSLLVLSISLDTFYTNKNYVASEFIEKAILFYIGYLSQQDNLNYISPMITETVKAQINGTEQRLAHLLFKVAVALGKLTHPLAVANDVDDETFRQLLVVCINEVRKINGAIDCEDAVRYQKE